jgi:hypothetical protein
MIADIANQVESTINAGNPELTNAIRAAANILGVTQDMLSDELQESGHQGDSEMLWSGQAHNAILQLQTEPAVLGLQFAAAAIRYREVSAVLAQIAAHVGRAGRNTHRAVRDKRHYGSIIHYACTCHTLIQRARRKIQAAKGIADGLAMEASAM